MPYPQVGSHIRHESSQVVRVPGFKLQQVSKTLVCAMSGILYGTQLDCTCPIMTAVSFASRCDMAQKGHYGTQVMSTLLVMYGLKGEQK